MDVTAGHRGINDREFRRVRELLEERAGIHLTEVKRRLVITRLAPRLRITKKKSYTEYLDLVESDANEADHFLSALTTNVTQFFREPRHFQLLEQQLFGAMLERPASDGRLRFWSAACSTGEEPYSLAIALSNAGLLDGGLDIRILATDIDPQVLAHARKGVYQQERVEQLPDAVLRRHFWRGAGSQLGKVRVKPALQEIVHFARLNLFDPWPMSGPFDVIFCRNVFIYFEQPARDELTRRFHQMLGPSGYLFLGHSESMTGPTASLFQPLGHTVFQKRTA